MKSPLFRSLLKQTQTKKSDNIFDILTNKIYKNEI